MKRKKLIRLLLSLTTMTCCPAPAASDSGFSKITPEQAKQMMESQPAPFILDVREQDEFATGHIRGAKLLPLSTIRPNSAAQLIPDKDQTVLVYCRSGRRSHKACMMLSKLGYTHIFDFGGIMDWPYEIVKD